MPAAVAGVLVVVIGGLVRKARWTRIAVGALLVLPVAEVAGMAAPYLISLAGSKSIAFRTWVVVTVLLVLAFAALVVWRLRPARPPAAEAP